MNHLIEGESEPARWHLHGWEAEISMTHEAALEQSRFSSTHLAASVSLYPEAVGVFSSCLTRLTDAQ
jgi:hypothetical protein